MTKLLLLSLFVLSLSARADELKLHLLRSPLGINWSTPWNLSVSTIKNNVIPFKTKRAFAISHVFVEVKCDSTGEHIYRGMTSAPPKEGSSESDMLFKQGYGLGLMFHVYPGLLEKDEDIIRDLAPYEGSDRYNSFTMKVSPKACKRMLRYANEFEERGLGKKYAGLQGDPLKGDGAGCSAFGVSFMRVAGLTSGFTKQWQQVIDVPTRFVGGEITKKKVDITYILKNYQAQWSNKEPHIHLEAWDPELMHNWVTRLSKIVNEGKYRGSWPADVVRDRMSYHLTLDMSDRETPTGSFWQY